MQRCRADGGDVRCGVGATYAHTTPAERLSGGRLYFTGRMSIAPPQKCAGTTKPSSGVKSALTLDRKCARVHMYHTII